MTQGRIRIGALEVDSVTIEQALARIEALVRSRKGGAVFTPNVDHVVKADQDSAFRNAYARADLCLADGMPIVWASRLIGTPLPEKVSGSDLVGPLMGRAADRRWRVYLLGGERGVAEAAARNLTDSLGVDIVGTDSPTVNADGELSDADATLGKLLSTRPDLVLVALGAPKQELWIDRFRSRLSPAVAIGVGASLDFIARRSRRAPNWVSRAGLEWLFRLMQEPRRLWRRYLLDDPKFVRIVLRERMRGRAGTSEP